MNNSESEGDDKIKFRIRKSTSKKKKFDTERLVKPTYSSLKRGRVLQRDPITNKTVSTLKASKIFSPANSKEARRMLENKIYLNNTSDINNDLIK